MAVLQDKLGFMIESPQIVGIEINPAAWQATPESIQAGVADFGYEWGVV